MKENIVRDNSFQFAISIVKIYQHLVGMKKENLVSQQLRRSGKSVSAIIWEFHCVESIHEESTKQLNPLTAIIKTTQAY